MRCDRVGKTQIAGKRFQPRKWPGKPELRADTRPKYLTCISSGAENPYSETELPGDSKRR